MMNIRKAFGTMTAVAAVASVSFTSAHAGLFPTLVAPPTFAGGQYTYTYSVNLDDQQNITGTNAAPTGGASGYFVTLYDVQGYVAGSASVAGPGTAQVQNTGFTGFGQAPVDDPTLPNITAFYTGSTPVMGPHPDLLTITFSSIYNVSPTLNVYYTGQANKATNGSLTGNIGFVEGPSPAGVPEPGTYAAFLVGGLGVLGLMVGARKRSTLA